MSVSGFAILHPKVPSVGAAPLRGGEHDSRNNICPVTAPPPPNHRLGEALLRLAAPTRCSHRLLPEYRGKIPEDSLGVSLNF